MLRSGVVKLPDFNKSEKVKIRLDPDSDPLIYTHQFGLFRLNKSVWYDKTHYDVTNNH